MKQNSDGTETPGADHRFRPGESGNTAGRPPTVTVREMEERCLAEIPTVINVLLSIMLDTKARAGDRIRAGELIANYGMGKPRQAILVNAGGAADGSGQGAPVPDAVTLMLERMIAAGASALAEQGRPQPAPREPAAQPEPVGPGQVLYLPRPEPPAEPSAAPAADGNESHGGTT